MLGSLFLIFATVFFPIHRITHAASSAVTLASQEIKTKEIEATSSESSPEIQQEQESQAKTLAPASEPSRRELKALLKEKSFNDSDYQNPYLLTQSGVLVAESLPTISDKMVAHFKANEIKALSHFPFRPTQYPNWKASLLPSAEEWNTEKELEGIKKCDLSYCFPKLNNTEEKAILMKSTDKFGTYKDLIAKRVERFLQYRKLLGFESRDDNKPAVIDLVNLSPLNQRDYSAIRQFFTKGFWEGAPAIPALAGSLIRTHTLSLDPNRLQPIYWVSEVFQLKETKSHLFIEFVIYSNHYFDAWVRVYETLNVSQYFTDGREHSVILISDLMEIDELKKSAFIRMLFKGKMVEAVQKAQKMELAIFQETRK